MDRNSKIFAPTIRVGGVTRPAKKTSTSTPSNKEYDNLMSKLKGDLAPTILNTFSYKSGDNIVNFTAPRIRSITKNRKHVAFLITGDSNTMSHQEAMKNLTVNDQNKITGEDE